VQIRNIKLLKKIIRIIRELLLFNYKNLKNYYYSIQIRNIEILFYFFYKSLYVKMSNVLKMILIMGTFTKISFNNNFILK